jgi:protein TonB
VVLSMTVGVDGMAHDISVTKSLDSGLDRKAVEAVQQWHFNPGTRNGEPVPVLATIEINFRLQ